MTIGYQDVFPVLAEALDDFKASGEDWEDRLSYPFMSDMVRFVCDRAYPEYDPLLRQFSVLLEKLSEEGDLHVRDLGHDGLESLSAKKERDVVSQYFGPRTLEVWNRVCAGERGQ